MIPELSKLCRTCLAPDDNLISIYEEKPPYTDDIRWIADIIGNLTNIMPVKFDGLPEQVCLPCCNEIEKIYSFKMKCINSVLVLRKMIEQDEEKLILPSSNIPSEPSESLIIKSEDPTCSFYVTHMDSQENQSKMIGPEDQTNLKTEFIIKEEPDMGEYDEKYDCEMEEELSESNTEGNLESNLCEDNSQNNILDETQESTASITNVVKKSNIATPEQSDKSENSKLKCPNCHKLFMHLARLKRHLKTHACINRMEKNKKSGFACTICDKKYDYHFSLQRHYLISHKQKLTKETPNNQSENNDELEDEGKNKLSAPFNKELNTIEAMRQCNCCKEVFENDEALAIHKTLTRHKKPRPKDKDLVCDICNKVFSFSHNLKLHLMSHKQIKPFKCEQCNQRFVRNSCLTRHLKTHTGDRPFTCEFCNKGFPYMYSLKIHERSHTEERPYSCTTCSMRFKFPNTLKEHQRTHTGEKPYACTLCPRRLSSKTNFRIHMKTHEKKDGSTSQQLVNDSEEIPVKMEII